MPDKNSVVSAFPIEIDLPSPSPPTAKTFIVLRVDGGPVVTITGTPELGYSLNDITEELIIPALYGVGFKGVDAYFDCSHADEPPVCYGPAESSVTVHLPSSDQSPADQPFADQEPVKRDPLDPLDNPYAPW